LGKGCVEKQNKIMLGGDDFYLSNMRKDTEKKVLGVEYEVR
jgi:hypothetical protein